ncbi:LAME_0H09450g1_1 [Lachancea meyersii CBS 8951]|uniref:Pre-mRNA-splicing factor CWC2 n=1 Tax=Lachancea meyersii CBS 8951 TaxID=1266667 RepID=A0A1G4KFV1_9SACH|nr:LAME_0H09450g1_1 [Lachancea meyersii CBS 8951]
MAPESLSREGSWKKRPAPIQVSEKELPSSIPPQTGLTFNVWYNKWSQGNTGRSRFVSPYKLDTESHEGYTRGDKTKRAFFCLYFTKGMCCLGKRCEYLHHVPNAEDIARLSLQSDVIDCFGREKHGSYREDMGGVGSFRKKNRTLYVGGITGALNDLALKAGQVENRIRFSFGKLGPLERIRYVETKNCAFVKYKHQASAEFAKEAMSNQTLLIPSDKEWSDRREGTGLLVKWANDDPSPEAQRREKEQQDQESLKVMLDLLEKNDAKIADASTDNTPSKKRLLESPEADNNSFQRSIFGSLSKNNLNRLKKLKAEKPATDRANQSSPASLVDYPSSDED